MHFFLSLPLLLGCALFSSRALGRWDHRQAERLRNYRDLGLEFYNDSLSYRAPWQWAEELPREREKARLEMGAGSLNQREFLFAERARISTGSDESWRLAYANEQIEDPRAFKEQDAIELSYRHPESGFRYGLLAEGASEKSFADLGLGLSWTGELLPGSRSSELSLELWWVDGMYESKKLARSDQRLKDPWALKLGLDLGWEPGRLVLHHSLETPLEWVEVSREQIYKGAATVSGAAFHLGEGEQTYYIEAESVWQREARYRLEGEKEEGYSYREWTFEAGQLRRRGSTYTQLAIWGLASDLRLARLSDDAASLFEDPERRRELAAFGSWHQPWEPGSSRAQVWGLYVNRVYIRTEAYRISTEVKAQWAYEWDIGKQGKFLLGTTWDIDQMVRDYPYQKIGFRPWGGGYAQLLAWL